MTKAKNKGIVQRTAEKIILEVQNEAYTEDPDAFILDDEETAKIRKIYRQTLFWSGFLGGLGVVVLFCTRYAFPFLFPRSEFHIPVIDFSFRYNIPFTLYGLVLAYAEIYILYYVNLKAIKKMVIICNYPHPSHPDFKKEIEMLAQVGLERAGKHGKQIGMNPYQGLPKIAVTFYLLINFYKAAISNIAIRFFVSRLAGRTLSKVFIDMLGVPVFTFWNILATRKILHEARIRIFSRPLTEKFVKQLYHDLANDQEFRSFLYDTLQYISMIKRNYNYSHYMFANLLLTTFKIPLKESHRLPEDYFGKLEKATISTQRAIEKVIIFGMVIDGMISTSENLMIKKAIDHGIITYSKEEIALMCENYYKGKGLPGLVSIV